MAAGLIGTTCHYWTAALYLPSHMFGEVANWADFGEATFLHAPLHSLAAIMSDRNWLCACMRGAQSLESVCDSNVAEVGILCRYEDGKYKQKKNTFTDFVAAAEHLINKTYTERSRLCIQVSKLSCCSLKTGQATYSLLGMSLCCTCDIQFSSIRHRLFMQGRSAGGLTMGAVINMVRASCKYCLDA